MSNKKLAAKTRTEVTTTSPPVVVVKPPPTYNEIMLGTRDTPALTLIFNAMACAGIESWANNNLLPIFKKGLDGIEPKFVFIKKIPYLLHLYLFLLQIIHTL